MKIVLWFILVLNTVALLASAFLFFTGSLEMFPTEEETSASRLVWGLFSGLFFLIEVTLVVVIRKFYGSK